MASRQHLQAELLDRWASSRKTNVSQRKLDPCFWMGIAPFGQHRTDVVERGVKVGTEDQRCGLIELQGCPLKPIKRCEMPKEIGHDNDLLAGGGATAAMALPKGVPAGGDRCGPFFTRPAPIGRAPTVHLTQQHPNGRILFCL